MFDGNHDVGPVAAQLIALGRDARSAGDHRVHLATARRVGKPPRGRHHLERDLSQLAATRLREGQHVRHSCAS